MEENPGEISYKEAEAEHRMLLKDLECYDDLLYVYGFPRAQEMAGYTPTDYYSKPRKRKRSR